MTLRSPTHPPPCHRVPLPLPFALPVLFNKSPWASTCFVMQGSVRLSKAVQGPARARKGTRGHARACETLRGCTRAGAGMVQCIPAPGVELAERMLRRRWGRGYAVDGFLPNHPCHQCVSRCSVRAARRPRATPRSICIASIRSCSSAMRRSSSAMRWMSSGWRPPPGAIRPARVRSKVSRRTSSAGDGARAVVAEAGAGPGEALGEEGWRRREEAGELRAQVAAALVASGRPEAETAPLLRRLLGDVRPGRWDRSGARVALVGEARRGAGEARVSAR